MGENTILKNFAIFKAAEFIFSLLFFAFLCFALLLLERV